MFYHISSKKGLTELEPRVSTHGQPWVYALTNPTIGLIFAGRDDLGNKADDSFTSFRVNKDNIPEVFELYSGCLDEILKNKDAYIYKLEDSGFMTNQTSWAPEWVSPNKTKVVDSKYIPDLLAEIKQAQQDGKFIIHYYEDTESYNKLVEEKITNYLQNCCESGWINISLIKHYENIVKKFVKENLDRNYRKTYENLSCEQLNNVFDDLDKDENNGRFVRKEMLYLYPKETINWINKKYDAIHNVLIER